MKTVEKALEILDIFIDEQKEIGVSELTEITGLNISTVHDILQELTKKDYIQQLVQRGKYSLGLKFISFKGSGNKIVASIDIIQPILHELCQQVNETVNIAINSGNYSVNVAIVQANHALRVIPVETQPAPLYCTGIGKIFLSSKTDEWLNNYLEKQQLMAFTSHTITDKNKLKRHIAKVHRDGYAIDNEEYNDGVRNLAVPIRYDGKIAAALGVVGPTTRLNKKQIKEIIPLVQKYAMNISEVIESYI